MDVPVSLPPQTFDLHLLSPPRVPVYNHASITDTASTQQKAGFISHPPTHHRCKPVQAPAIIQIDWFPLARCVFCTCLLAMNGGICHILIFLLLTSQFIRCFPGPWWSGELLISWPLLLLLLYLFISPFKEKPETEKKEKNMTRHNANRLTVILFN